MHNRFPNKRIKKMNECKEAVSTSATVSSFGNAFLLAEENFKSKPQEWKVQKSKKDRRYKKETRENIAYDDNSARSNRHNEPLQSHRGSKRPSENKWGHNKRLPGEGNKYHGGKGGVFQKEKSGRDSVPNCNSKHCTNTNSSKRQDYHQSLSFTKLQEMSAKDSTDIIRILANSRSGIDELLEEDLKPDWMYLIIKILSKLTRSDWEENKEHVLNRVAKPEFFKKIREFVISIATDDNILESHKRREGIEQFFEGLLIFYQAVMIKLPSFAAEHLSAPLKATKMAMENVSEYQSVTINQSLIDKIKQQIIDFEVRRNEKEERERVLKEERDLIYPKPIGSINNIPLFPQPEDIVNTKGSVVPNKVKGPYNNVEHYLDVHFRLLREDFISPLRQGINDFRVGQSTNNPKAKKKISNLRIYRKVKFLRTKVISDKVGYDLCFDPDKKLRVKWECTKRFLYGSLLLFTTDNFHSFFLATVIKRDLNLVDKERVISVQLTESAHEKSCDILSKEFLMAESEVYFEPYYNVLKALQRFNSSTFPMKRYLVNVETKIGRPAHTMNGSDIYTISAGDKGRKTIKLFESRCWPSSSDLGFDDSQLLAFKTALTRNLAVIQGPPGTGKTYLGLKIAAALLDNSAMWNLDRLSPILVICFTNHALDQFLEGVLGLTNNLIRIGGRSKSEILEPFNLRERRRSVVDYAPNYSQAALMKDIKRKMTEIFENIKIIQDNLEKLERNDGLLSLKTMKIAMNSHHHSFFRNDDDFIQWLLVGLSHKIKPNKNLLSTAGNMRRERTKYVVEEFEIDLADYENAVRLKDVLFDRIDLEDSEEAGDDSIAGNLELSNSYSCTLYDIEKRIEQCTTVLDSLLSADINEIDTINKIRDTKNAESDLKDILLYFKENLLKYEVPSSNDEIDRLHSAEDLNSLNMDERWILYKIWVSYMKNGNRMLMGQLEEQYRMGSRRYEEVRQFDDLRVVQQADVVGITTTTAARLQGMLRELKPKIVIVEEAAEVLEAHIVASLSVHCQHLILIGDHKQLRPSPSDYRLAKDFQLDVSLFERLINNDVGYCTLSTQHRMRPEISRLLVPTIYPTLVDHPSTLNRERVLGMDTNIFFMTHPHPEEDAEDIMSKRNLFEAKLVMSFARHLLLQGYRPDEITVLTTYNGQMYLMKEEQRRLEISKDLLVTVVDNYQGEENKIILLSLVRSNSDKKIGFLKTENRVCVALSRARDGLYVFGNMDCLAAESELWQKIRQSFMDQKAYGPALLLRCETHRNEITRVVSHTDFNTVMEGGCSKLCGEVLPCGHHCKSLCHVSKDRHLRYRCSEPCKRFLCNDRHPCHKKCYQKCGRCELSMERTLACGHKITLPCCVEYKNMQCKHPVSLHFPDCNHTVEVECYRKDYKNCPEPCLSRLPCGHSCTRTCHELDDPDHINYECPKPCAKKPLNCTTEGHKCPLACFEECKPCKTKVFKRLECGHSVTAPCTQKSFICELDCSRMLPCGHPCRRRCCDECGGCAVKVKKIVPLCGHEVKIACSEEPKNKHCAGKCSVTLECGHKCARLCMDTCSADFCEQPTDLPVALPCKHTGATLPCNIVTKVNLISANDKEQLVQYCKEPCLTMLNCKHVCSGTCGQCMQGRIHKVCEEACGNILICGHSCSVPCRMICPPCNKKCQMKCMHSKCPKKCGEPCDPCKEPCEIRCIHTRCTKKCGDLCNRKPCTEPCLLPLESCKHPCVGFCGEPCPPCKKCQKEHYECFFYTDEEEEENAKWVLLNDCKHVFESRNLEHWFGMDDESSEIKLKKCPKCSTSVSTTTRYMNLVKKTFMDIQTVKEKVFGHIKEIRKEREDLLKKIESISPKEMENYSNDGARDKNELSALRKLLKEKLSYISSHHKRNELSDHKASLYKYMALVYLSIQERIVKDWDKLTELCKGKAFRKVNFLLSILNQRKDKISEEEISSFNLELNRLHRYFDLFLLESSGNFVNLKAFEQQTQIKILNFHEQLKSYLYSFNVFKSEIDNKVKKIIKEEALLLETIVSDEERIMIHTAMASSFHGGVRSVSRWYKCAGCGDVYCVANCGAVNQITNCGRCRTRIGDHSRVVDSEMARALQRM